MKINDIHMMRIRPGNDQMHRHDFFELVYVVGGRASHHLEQERMTLLAGDYFIIDTGTEHCYRDTEDFEIINCLFRPEYIDRALADCPTLAALLSNQVLRFGVPMTVQAADRIYHDTDGTVGRLMTAMDEEFRQRLKRALREQLSPRHVPDVVKQIPKGKVASYGQVAALAGNPRWARVVGYALHVNPDPEGIPCYRVVTKDGRISDAFAFGGGNEQIALLKADGIEFVDDTHVDMKRFQWRT